MFDRGIPFNSSRSSDYFSSPWLPACLPACARVSSHPRFDFLSSLFRARKKPREKSTRVHRAGYARRFSEYFCILDTNWIHFATGEKKASVLVDEKRMCDRCFECTRVSRRYFFTLLCSTILFGDWRQKMLARACQEFRSTIDSRDAIGRESVFKSF